MSFALAFRRLPLLVALILSALSKLHGAEEPLKGVPNISTRTESASSWALSADVLFWLASEEVASIWADVITVGDNTSSWSAEGFDFNWDYGLRVGAGHGLIHDQWDTMLYWTYFRTSAKHTIPFEPDRLIIPEFFAALLSKNTPLSLHAKWSLLFNIFDWELGRSYWVSQHVSLRPFLGIKGGWIHQSIHGKYQNLIIDKVHTHNSAQEHLKNNFWGVGPLGGLNSKWRARQWGPHSLDFFGDFSMATLWGNWQCSDVYKNTASQKSSVNMKNATLGALMFRGFMGISWDVIFYGRKASFNARLGYEMQIWLNQLRLATFQLQRLHDDLTLQGITFNCRFDF